MMEEVQYISLSDAAKELNVKPGTLHYYIRRLKIESHRFELDKRAYLTMEDFNRIKKLKEQAALRSGSENVALPPAC